MKPKFKNLTEVLAFELEGMYVAEKTLQKDLPPSLRSVSSKKLKSEYKKYLESAADKKLKLKRIFSYLLIKPIDRKGTVIVKMLQQSLVIAKSPTKPELKDAQLLASLQSIAGYKTSIYEIALIFAEELELTTVVELLGQIISWEKETHLALARIALGGLAMEAAAL